MLKYPVSKTLCHMDEAQRSTARGSLPNVFKEVKRISKYSEKYREKIK